MRRIDVGERSWLRELRGDQSFREFTEGTEFEGARRSYLSSLECGRVTPGLTIIPALARAYGVTPLWLAGKFLEEVERAEALRGA
jgi:transcriptional regulator with XRE-family HTH domain